MLFELQISLGLYILVLGFQHGILCKYDMGFCGSRFTSLIQELLIGFYFHLTFVDTKISPYLTNNVE